MEIELAWRQEEIAFFKNQLNYVTEDKKGKYRKSLVLILYSHFEGYTKICLQTYIQYINSQNLDRRDVNFGLMLNYNLRFWFAKLNSWEPIWDKYKCYQLRF